MSKFQVLLESPIINYAMVLNKYPIIRAIELENDQDKDIDNLIIEINANFINPFKIGIKIKAKETLVLDNNIIELVPKIEFFRDLIERVPESISINIYEEGEKGEPLVCNLDIYPPNFWNGFEITPEITSAFVTPNDPYVVQIIDEATKILKEIDPKTPHFCGYQANSKTHVMNMINAIYTALLNKNITYIDPPASFGKGQKIFTCEQILSQRLGTCIDLAVLIASCLERCGLYPLIIHQDGHAYVGCWLIEYYLENPICTDIGAIEKRLVNNLNEIVLIEATALCKQIPFVAAVNVGINHIYQDADKFICAIDVYSTRNRGIVPISGKKVILESEKEDLDNKAIQIDVDETEYVNTANTKIKDKIDLWSRKLLDLSMRNKLLNFNFNRHGLPLIKVNLATLEDNLIMDKEYELVQGITVESEISINDENSFIINLFKSGKIVTLNKEHSDRMLANIYREAKNSLEEQGANNLFLAIGFLRYFEYEESNAPRYAPILLLNMEIRKSIHGYTIKRGELETQMNITLTELLRRNYGIELGDLAKEVKDDFGSDVNKIFNIIRKTIVDKPGWDVIEEAFLGNFSFNKFVLWQDLQNRKDAIKEHPITGGLVKGFHVWSDLDSENINESSLDYKFNASDLLCPVPYDSSQLLAVALTDMGKSFILHGAPGTGKSQTITNIIANALGKGKSVLFVAEKRAALDVVHNRLSKIGLKPFCLELHSDKSNKAEIMEQFQEVMNLTKINPSFLDGTSKNIQTLRNKLNAYVNALHKKRKIGFSVYEVITKLIEMKDIPAPLSFSPDLLEECTLGHIKHWEPKIEQIMSCGKLCEPIAENPWKDCGISNYNLTIKDDIIKALNTAAKAITDEENNIKEICSTLKIEKPITKRESIKEIQNFLDIIKEFPANYVFILNSDIDDLTQKLSNLKEKINVRNQKLSNIENKWTSDVLKLNLDELINAQKESEKGGFVRRFKKIESGYDILCKYAKTSINPADFYIEINQIKDYNELNDNLNKEIKEIFKDNKIDFEEIDLALAQVNTLKEKAFAFCENNLEKYKSYLSFLEDLIKNKNIFFSNNNSFENITDRLLTPLKEVDKLASLLVWNIDSNQENYFDYIKQSIEKYKNNMNSLDEWADYKKVTSDKEQYRLTELLNLYEADKIENKELKNVFIKSLYKAWTLYIIGSEPALNEFSRPIFEQTINQFQKLNKEAETYTKDKILELLFNNKPQLSNVINAQEYSILTREVTKKRSAKPIRGLFKETKHILPKLKPCFLMSPMSCAEFLDDTTMFDLVIFDEASQIPTADAVGAISRGKSVVIVGDPKQMPPTSFFNSSDGDGDDLEVEKDLESILDDCLAINIPSCFLKWHYRSKHEDLIAYSNFRYYDNNMMTFPSAGDVDRFVKFVPLKGYYDQGKTRTNLVEALAIVKEVKRRLEHPVLQNKSIGVVTFSMAQQILIETKMDEMLSQNPHLDPLYNNPKHNEPVFIKNLENVQGDERDVILFSVCYGPDKKGKVSINFGPMNKDGGQRRLNVAISRARYEMIIFSTLDPEQIDLKRTNSLGVHDLKEFLEFAKHGKDKLSKLTGDSLGKNFVIENKIKDRLTEKGYKVQTQIGFSGFRIDLAIINKDTNRFILGITCDGESYKTGKTAKDRNDSRNSVLKMLGWKIHRVWIQDFWANPEREIERIEEAYQNAKKALTGFSEDKTEELSYSEEEFTFDIDFSEDTETTETENSVKTNKTNESNKETSKQDKAESKDKQEEQENAEPTLDIEEKKVTGTSEQNPEKTDIIENNDTEISKEPKEYKEEPKATETTPENNTTNIESMETNAGKINSYEYVFFNLPVRKEDFYSEENYPIISNQIEEIIAHEAPVTHEYLIYRIKDLWGFKQLGKNIREQVENIIKKMKLNKKRENGVITYWGEIDPETYSTYRYNNRNIEDIPQKEIENAIVEAVCEAEEIDRDNLISEVAHKFGFAKTGPKIKEIVDDNISKALKAKKVFRIGRSSTILKNNPNE